MINEGIVRDIAEDAVELFIERDGRRGRAESVVRESAQRIGAGKTYPPTADETARAYGLALRSLGVTRDHLGNETHPDGSVRESDAAIIAEIGGKVVAMREP